MVISTRLTEQLGVKHPIMLAPMDLIADARLATAVSRAGGFGMIGGGYGEEAWLKTQLDGVGEERVGVGFITWSLAKNPRLLDLALERRPPAIMLSFGDVRPFAGNIKQAGASLICQVQTLGHAREAIASGADILVAQGAEAGGHGVSRGALPLVPAVVDLAAPRRPCRRGRGDRRRARPGRRINARRGRRPAGHASCRQSGSRRACGGEGADRAGRGRSDDSGPDSSTSPEKTSGRAPSRAGCCATDFPTNGPVAKRNCCDGSRTSRRFTARRARKAISTSPPSSRAKLSISFTIFRRPARSSNEWRARRRSCLRRRRFAWTWTALDAQPK